MSKVTPTFQNLVLYFSLVLQNQFVLLINLFVFIYRDIFSVLQEPDIFELLCNTLVTHAKNISPSVECVAALESRGFLFGPLLALQLKVPFTPIRKKGKLPGEKKSVSYKLEYGEVCIINTLTLLLFFN